MASRPEKNKKILCIWSWTNRKIHFNLYFLHHNSKWTDSWLKPSPSLIPLSHENRFVSVFWPILTQLLIEELSERASERAREGGREGVSEWVSEWVSKIVRDFSEAFGTIKTEFTTGPGRGDTCHFSFLPDWRYYPTTLKDKVGRLWNLSLKS